MANINIDIDLDDVIDCMSNADKRYIIGCLDKKEILEILKIKDDYFACDIDSAIKYLVDNRYRFDVFAKKRLAELMEALK